MRLTTQKTTAMAAMAMMTYFTTSETHSACSVTVSQALPAAAPSEQRIVFHTAEPTSV